MRLSPPLRARLTAALQDIATQNGTSTIGWSDDQSLSALTLINAGHALQDAVAIVVGDAVLEDGRVDYNPGCAWIDFALAHRNRTPADAERIVSEWETKRFQQCGAPERIGLDTPAASAAATLRPDASHVLF